MKTFISRVLVAFMLTLSFTYFSACTSQEEQAGDDAVVETVSEEGDANGEELSYAYTAHYICPMHCEGSGSEVAGKCSVCEMEYVINENWVEKTVDTAEEAVEGALDSEEDHTGHDH